MYYTIDLFQVLISFVFSIIFLLIIIFFTKRKKNNKRYIIYFSIIFITMYAVFTPRYTPIENLKYPEIEKATTKLINNLNDYKYNKIIFYKYIDGIFFVEALVQKKEENPIKVIIIYNKRLEVKEFFIETSYDINDINISDIK